MQWVIGAVAALILGFSKTGIPGTGILGVALMAFVFNGRLAVGATLPILICADCFAVAFYRTHTEWARLKQLVPWVVGGIAFGTVFLKILGNHKEWKDPISPIIGGIVLLMLGVTLLRKYLGDRLVPTSRTGTALTGTLAGFSTMVSNAAGPIMQIYMVATGMPKDQMMGTTASYFFIFNLTKILPMAWLTMDDPSHPMFTAESFQFNMAMAPVVIAGAYLGKWILPYIPQKQFNNAVLVLTAVASIKLLIPF